jgi:hypothetical protein
MVKERIKRVGMGGHGEGREKPSQRAGERGRGREGGEGEEERAGTERAGTERAGTERSRAGKLLAVRRGAWGGGQKAEGTEGTEGAQASGSVRIKW